jgi:hypothetical protein
VSDNVPINDAQRTIGHRQSATVLDLSTPASGTGDQHLRETAADDLLPEGLVDGTGELVRNRGMVPDLRICEVGGTGLEPATPTVSR